jgi:serine/threonine-protein kinase HipA
VVGRVLAELPAAVDEVAAMPAGGEGLDRFADAIAERARTIGEHAALEGLSDVESTPEPAAGASHYDG